ncbi:glycosyltransferase family 4 protein [Klebsiella variicola]
MKKIAVIYHFFPHYRSGIIKELLNSKEYEFHFFGSDIPEYSGIKRYLDIPAERFHIMKFKKIKGFIFQKELIKLSFSKDFDALIILADPHFLMTWPSSIIARINHKKVIFWTHGWTRTLKGMRYIIKKQYHNLADALLLYGHRAKEISIKSGYPEEQTHVIYNCLDYEKQLLSRNALRSLSISENKKKYYSGGDGAIVTVARLIQSCRFDLLIDALYILKKEYNKKPEVIIIGEGPEHDFLAAYANQKAVDNQINFMGACYDENVLSRVIYAADVTVSPGKVGLLAMHSLNYGTPVITHDNFEFQMPEYEAITDNVTGSFFEYNSAESLAKEILVWTKKVKDEETIKACHDVIDRLYNPRTQSRIIHEVLNEKK